MEENTAATFDHREFINVPLNDRGKQAIVGNEYVEFNDDDFKSMEYTLEAHKAMTWLIFKFNDTFDILIDDFEDEVLPADKVGEALELAKSFGRSAPEKHKPVIAEFIALLEFARDTNMPVAFNF